jgi:hypothetical protein
LATRALIRFNIRAVQAVEFNAAPLPGLIMGRRGEGLFGGLVFL